MAQGFLYVGFVVAKGFFFVVKLVVVGVHFSQTITNIIDNEGFRTDRKQFDEAFKCQFRASSVMLSGYERIVG